MDPYEEFARLAGRHAAMAGAATRRYTDRPPSTPVESTDPGPHVPLWLAGRGGVFPLDGAIEDESGDEPAAEPSTEPAADAYEEFAMLARQYAAAETAPRQETDRSPEAPTPPSSDQTPGVQAPSDAALVSPEPSSGTDNESRTPDSPSSDETSWPAGERRSAARQARKPLPAALQAAVDSDPRQADSPTSSSRRFEATGPRPVGERPTSQSLTADRTPGILRRYASAIGIFALFIAAGGAAAGIAALRGPVPVVTQTPAQDRAAAEHIVLRASDFPTGWTFSPAALSSGSYGIGSVLVIPSLVRVWVTAHPACAKTLYTLSAAMRPSTGQPTAVSASQATRQAGLGGSWQIANAVAFHGTAAQVGNQVSSMQRLLARPDSRACISQFWAAELLPPLAVGSHVVMSVSPAPVPPIPGNPPAWSMSMNGIATVRNVAQPIHFQITQFGSGPAEVSLVTTSKIAPLSPSVGEALLKVLGTRVERFAS